MRQYYISSFPKNFVQAIVITFLKLFEFNLDPGLKSFTDFLRVGDGTASRSESWTYILNIYRKQNTSCQVAIDTELD